MMAFPASPNFGANSQLATFKATFQATLATFPVISATFSIFRQILLTGDIVGGYAFGHTPNVATTCPAFFKRISAGISQSPQATFSEIARLATFQATLATFCHFGPAGWGAQKWVAAA